MSQARKPRQYRRYRPGRWETIAAEAPVSLAVNGEVWLTFTCTPVNLDAPAVGFLYNEGLLKAKGLCSERRDASLCSA